MVAEVAHWRLGAELDSRVEVEEDCKLELVLDAEQEEVVSKVPEQ